MQNIKTMMLDVINEHRRLIRNNDKTGLVNYKYILDGMTATQLAQVRDFIRSFEDGVFQYDESHYEDRQQRDDDTDGSVDG